MMRSLSTIGWIGVALLAACGPDPGAPRDAGAADGTVDATDASPGDAALSRDGAVDAGPVDTGPTRYPPDQVHSPISDSVVARLEAIYAASSTPDDRVFMKVGASGTVSAHLLYCFAGAAQPQYQLAWDGGQDESGGEVVYQLELTESTPLRMIVLDRGGVDIDLHLLGASADPAGCLDRADRILETTLDAGTYHLVLDTYVPSDGIPRTGDYLLVVLACAPGDPDCT